MTRIDDDTTAHACPQSGRHSGLSGREPLRFGVRSGGQDPGLRLGELLVGQDSLRLQGGQIL
jgi:hypothetical protein